MRFVSWKGGEKNKQTSSKFKVSGPLHSDEPSIFLHFQNRPMLCFSFFKIYLFIFYLFKQIHDMYPFTIPIIDNTSHKKMYIKNLKLYTDVEKYLWIARVEKVDPAGR